MPELPVSETPAKSQLRGSIRLPGGWWLYLLLLGFALLTGCD
jgi:hypothetical protein